MLLLIVATLRMISYGKLTAQLIEIPKFSFDYDTLEFNDAINVAVRTYQDTRHDLSAEEINEVTKFIESYRYKVWRIGPDGLSQGPFYIDECSGYQIAHCPPPNIPENYYYNPDTQQWDYIYGVDKDGKYLGNVPYVQCSCIANSMPNFDYERWDDQKKQWCDGRTLDQIKSWNIESINETAKFAKISGTLYQGEIWSTNTEDVSKLLDAKEDGSVTSWPDQEGVVVDFSDYTITDLKKAVNDYLAEVESARIIAVNKINECATAEDAFKVILR
jgi:hypothetical protein